MSRRAVVLVALVTGFVGLHASAAFAVAPANDDIASATTLTATPVTGSNVGATSDSPFDVCKAEDNGCNEGGMSVWYRLPNPGKGWLAVNGDSVNTNFNAQLAVYHGAAGSVTDTSGITFDFTSWQRFGTAVTTDPVGVETIPGDDYFVVVDGYSNGVTVPSGNFRFDWSFTPAPVNDNFASAKTLTTTVGAPSTSDNASTTGATLETNESGISGTEPDSSFFSNNGAHSVWYKWVAPAAGQVTIDTHTSSFDTVLAVYTGSTLPTLTEVPGATSDDTTLLDNTSEVTFTATQSQTYRIKIDGKDDGLGGAAFGAFTLHLNEVIAPANDNFANAITISGASGTQVGTNAGASLQTNEPEGDFFFFGGCNYNDTDSNQPAGKTVWYNWTAPSSGNFSFDTLSSAIPTFNTAIAAYTGSAVGTLTQVACNDDYSPSTLLSRMVINATGGQLYRIQVDGADDQTNPTSGTFTLKWAATPANDNFANAATISGASGSTASSNAGASVEFGEPQNAGVLNGASVWFNWTAPGNGTYYFKTKGSSFDTTLGIYTGSTVSSLTSVASNNDVNGGDNSSYAQFAATNGTTYHVSVDGFQGATGSIALAWALVPPPNDDFADATLVTGTPGTAVGTNVGATAQAGEPAFLAGGKTVWWKWVATGNSTFEFDTEGSSIDTLLGVYTGSAVNGLTVVGQNDNVSGGDNKSKVTFAATSGTTYYMAVDGNGGATGALTLNWSVPPADTTPPTINYFIPGDGQVVGGTNVPVSGDATDTGSGVASMTFKIDDGSIIPPVTDTVAPFGTSFDSTLLSDGLHTITVTATDTSGNTTTPETHTFVVENTGPMINSFTPAAGALVHGTAVPLTGDATDIVSGVASMTFKIDDGSKIAPITDMSAPFGGTFNSKLLADGTHTLTVIATNAVGSTSILAHTFTVDNTAPVQPHFTSVLAPFTGATTASVNFADTDATSGVKSYQVQVEKANFNAPGFGAWAVAPGATALSTAISGGAGVLATTSYRLTGLVAGYDYCFRVIATDNAGNVSVASKLACTARLIDDKSAVHSAGWTQAKSAAYYAGTFSTAKSANRTLTIAGFRGVRLGIMAVQCSTCGAIKVYVGTTLIKTVSLVSAVRKDTIIVLPVFSSRAGIIKIVTTSTKAVTIDGIGASRT
jgi:hypothetical protein